MKVSDLITSGEVEVAKRPSKKRKDDAEPSSRPAKKTTGVARSREPAVVIIGEGSHTSGTPGRSKTSTIPVEVPSHGVTMASQPRGRGRGSTVVQGDSISGNSLFNLHHVPSLAAGEDKRHSGAQFCPEWDVNVNDRCKDPRVAHELLVNSVLPRDNTYTRKLNPVELMQGAAISWASTTVFFAEMHQRFENFIETYESPAELQKRITDLEEKLKATELERDKATAAKKKVEVANNSLLTALDEEKNRRVQEEKSNKEAIDQAGVTAVVAFRKSE